MWRATKFDELAKCHNIAKLKIHQYTFNELLGTCDAALALGSF